MTLQHIDTMPDVTALVDALAAKERDIAQLKEQLRIYRNEAMREIGREAVREGVR